jgi:hypothetical protein
MSVSGGRKRGFGRVLKSYFKRRRKENWIANYPGVIPKRSRLERFINKVIKLHRQRRNVLEFPALVTNHLRPPRREGLFRFAVLGFAVAALGYGAVFLVIQNPFASRSTTASTKAGSVTLYETKPSGYASLRKGPVVGSCETNAFETSKPGEYRIQGFGIINSIKGETPIWVYVEIAKGGKTYYATAETTERSDIVKEFNNPLLLYSGYKLLLPAGLIAPPFEVKSYLVFDDRSFPCMFTARVS